MLKQSLTISALCLVLASCSGGKDKAAAQAADDEVPQVEVGLAQRQDVEHTRQYTATIEAENTNNIAPQTANRITTIAVREGDRVHRGQVLVTLDHSNIDQSRVRLDNAQREYDRARQLLDIGSGTQQQVDQLKTELDAARSQYNNLRENAVLTSPISGVVTARNYDPGDMTGQLPVLSIGQLSPTVKAIINVSETDLAQVHKGQEVTLTFDAFPDETFKARITRLYPQVDASTRTFPAEVAVNNPGERILPGMFGRVNITLNTTPSTVVPDRAVVKQLGSGHHFIYIYRGGKVEYKNVQLGERVGTVYEVLSGVEPGDTVIITGQSRLQDGTQAQILTK